MAQEKPNETKLVESISVRRVPRFNTPGSRKVYEYTVSIVTQLGNSGTFTVDEQTYENDQAFTEWLQEAIFQLDKANQMVGA